MWKAREAAPRETTVLGGSAVLLSIASAEADVIAQIRHLTERRDELQVELGAVRESLEELHESKRALAELRAAAEAAEVEGESGDEEDEGGEALPPSCESSCESCNESSPSK